MRIITKEDVLQKKLEKAVFKKLRTFDLDNAPDFLADPVYEVAPKIRTVINDEIYKSATYASLQNGILKRDFGLSEGSLAQLPEVFQYLFHINFFFNTSNKHFKTIIEITTYGRTSPEIVKATSRAAYFSDKSNELIDWLYWLLFEGTNIINEEYYVKSEIGKGRSYLGYMKKTNKGKGFSVDPEFAGVEGNNFVTEAMKAAIPQIESIIRNHK